MMKTIGKNIMRLMLILSMIFTLLLTSCLNEDPVDNDDDEIADLQLDLSMNEYPRSGDIVGNLSSNLTGTVEFELVSQSVADAMIIIGNDLTVGDWLAYDYETNETITATIEASNETETQVINVEVTINNIDDIWAFLSASREEYEVAEDGDWVPIIESEYNDLANYLAEVTKSGATDAHFSSTASLVSFQAATVANDNGNTIPSGSYLFAFKNYSWANNAGNSKVKISEGDAGGPYMNVGSTLPLHNDEYNFFVLKGAESSTSAEAYLGMYASVNPAYRNISGTSYRWNNSDTDNLDNSSIDQVFLYQGLSTTLKQWD